ncbi:hypothetical protein [Streptomyces sp. NPDC056682]|uniref:hypothetical protein n=1 Tax=Streptomyces sp. NPDC056682 TaxID=3345909 RepID=UPI0036B04DE3
MGGATHGGRERFVDLRQVDLGQVDQVVVDVAALLGLLQDPLCDAFAARPVRVLPRMIAIFVIVPPAGGRSIRLPAQGADRSPGHA